MVYIVLTAMKNYYILVSLGLIFVGQISAQTRYACLRMNSFLDSSGDSSEEEMSASSTMTGSLGCEDRPGTRILVSKVIHGRGGLFASCASPNEYCDDVIYSNSALAEMCDRNIRCFPTITSKLIPQCGTMSNFIHVEYECINPWSVFDICHESNTNVQLSTLYIMSPKTTPTASTCECIIKGRDNGQVSLDYVHSNTDDLRCSSNYLLVESRLLSNKTTIDKKNNICGRKTVAKDIHQGSVRLTYGTKGIFFRDGFMAKISVTHNSDPEISVQCGAVFSEKDKQINAQGDGFQPYRPIARGPFIPYGPYGQFMTNDPPFRGPLQGRNPPNTLPGRNTSRFAGPWVDRRGPSPWSVGRIRPPHWSMDYRGGIPYDQRRFAPNSGRFGPPNNSSGIPTNNQAHFPNDRPLRGRAVHHTTVSPFWRLMQVRRSGNLDLFADGPGSRPWGFQQVPPRGRTTWPQNDGPPPSVTVKNTPASAVSPSSNGSATNSSSKPANLPATVEFIGKSVKREEMQPGSKAPQPPSPSLTPGEPQAIMNDDKGSAKFPKEAGRLAAYTAGGIGAVLCSVGAIVMVVVCTKRRKRRNDTSGNEPSAVVGPIYSLPSHNLGRVHVNTAYVSDGEGSIGDSEDLDHSEDPYNTMYTTSRASREDRDGADDRATNGTTADMSSGTVLGVSNLACPARGEMCATSNPIYDNNI